MPSDFLIDQLVGDLRPVRRSNPRRQLAILLGLAAIELAGFLALGTLRPDAAAALGRAAFWWKMGGLALLAAFGVHIALGSFNPVSSPRSGLRRWLAVVAGLFLAGWVIDAAGQGVDALATRLMWRMGVECLTVMSILSIPPVIALGVMMRRGAPTDRQASSVAVGVAAATWGALIFAFHCPSDDPFYIVFWYSLGVGTITLIARVILPRISRW
ncbi:MULTISPECIES: NrsF family protein [Sphingomonadaceae]|jgi:hypothetical protein|uniref:NrsF family protein n=1 Tax=Sphingomonadales TaxID=204457 RepID=UPI0012BB42FD|nr:DUF1109 domain-containing protein [Sphingobium sp. CAP-1]QGP77844.1 DUF1109 family protein [Sphingobium sp. CAP-1]